MFFIGINAEIEKLSDDMHLVAENLVWKEIFSISPIGPHGRPIQSSVEFATWKSIERIGKRSQEFHHFHSFKEFFTHLLPTLGHRRPPSCPQIKFCFLEIFGTYRKFVGSWAENGKVACSDGKCFELWLGVGKCLAGSEWVGDSFWALLWNQWEVLRWISKIKRLIGQCLLEKYPIFIFHSTKFAKTTFKNSQ